MCLFGSSSLSSRDAVNWLHVTKVNLDQRADKQIVLSTSTVFFEERRSRRRVLHTFSRVFQSSGELSRHRCQGSALDLVLAGAVIVGPTTVHNSLLAFPVRENPLERVESNC